jgi:hypothetical protein
MTNFFARKVSRHTFYYEFKNQYEIDVAELFCSKNFQTRRYRKIEFCFEFPGNPPMFISNPLNAEFMRDLEFQVAEHFIPEAFRHDPTVRQFFFRKALKDINNNNWTIPDLIRAWTADVEMVLGFPHSCPSGEKRIDLAFPEHRRHLETSI